MHKVCCNQVQSKHAKHDLTAAWYLVTLQLHAKHMAVLVAVAVATLVTKLKQALLTETCFCIGS